MRKFRIAKLPVAHVRGLILLFSSHWPHIEVHDSRRPLYDDFSVFRHRPKKRFEIILPIFGGAEKHSGRP